MTKINKEGYYIGPELQWGVEDIEYFAEANDMEFSEEDCKRILRATFEDNEMVSKAIQPANGAQSIRCAMPHLRDHQSFSGERLHGHAVL